MTLFSLLLVLGWERLFKLGEHWQLDHLLEPLFRPRQRFSLLRTLLMVLLAMALTALCLLALRGLFFGLPQLLFWIVVGLLCIGAGSVRLHYHAYLKAAGRNDTDAHNAMAEELALIHGLPGECSEREYLCELQNALLWINFRFYLAPLFWFVVGGPWGPVLLVG
ncbi:beta-lactamase regulator AmpE, partial [Erwinia sp. B116]